MPLARGDIMRVPAAPDRRPPTTREHLMVVDRVFETANGLTYRFRDQGGQAILIRQPRLRWLQERFERELQDIDG